VVVPPQFSFFTALQAKTKELSYNVSFNEFLKPFANMANIEGKTTYYTATKQGSRLEIL